MDEAINDQEYLFINLNNIGISLYRERKFKEAIKYFEKAIKLDDTKPMIFFNKAKCEESLEQFNKAIEDYEKGLSLESKNAKNLRRLALLYQKVGNFDKSIEKIDKALVLEPKNEEYKKIKSSNEVLKKEMSEIKSEASAKNYSKIEKLCQKILKEAPQAYIVQFYYVIALWSKSKHKEIIKFLQEDVSEENKNINKDLNYYLAFSLSHECQFEEAKEIINKMLKEDIKESLKKKYNDILKMMKINESKLIEGDKLTKEGKYEEAIKLYDSALENEKNSTVFKSKILNNRAMCYLLMKENKKALKDLNESTIVNPDFSLTYLMKGMINTQIESPENAKKDFAKAKELDPSMSKLIKEINTKIDKTSKEKKEKKDKDKDKKDDGEMSKKVKSLLNDLPCVLKSVNDNIERYNICLKKISLDKMRICKENRISSKEMESKESKAVINDDEISLGLTVFKQGGNLKFGLKNDQKRGYEKSTVVAKRILYSIILDKKDIDFTDDFKKEIKEIADLESSDKIKAEKLEEIFKEIGLYVPLKLYIGGLYTFNTEKLTKEEKKELVKNISADINIHESLVEMKNTYCNKKEQEKNFDFLIKTRNYIGGEMDKDYEDWIKTVDEDNCEFIEYSEFRLIFDFLSDDLKKKLSGPVELIMENNKKIIDYVKIIEEINNSKGEQNYVDQKGTLIIGKFSEEKPYIYCDTIDIKEDYKLLKVFEKDVKQPYDDIIVGLTISNNRKDQDDNKNGTFTFQNPLLKNEINIKFKSNRNHSMIYRIKVFLMKYPE